MKHEMNHILTQKAALHKFHLQQRITETLPDKLEKKRKKNHKDTYLS
jgi:hypothetical protein